MFFQVFFSITIISAPIYPHLHCTIYPLLDQTQIRLTHLYPGQNGSHIKVRGGPFEKSLEKATPGRPLFTAVIRPENHKPLLFGAGKDERMLKRPLLFVRVQHLTSSCHGSNPCVGMPGICSWSCHGGVGSDGSAWQQKCFTTYSSSSRKQPDPREGKSATH